MRNLKLIEEFSHYTLDDLYNDAENYARIHGRPCKKLHRTLADFRGQRIETIYGWCNEFLRNIDVKTDKDVLFIHHCMSLKQSIIRWCAFSRKWTKLKKYLETRYDDSKSIQESYFRIIHHIETRPKCKFCGKPLKFIGGFDVFARSGVCNSHQCRHIWYVISKATKDEAEHVLAVHNYRNYLKNVNITCDNDVIELDKYVTKTLPQIRNSKSRSIYTFSWSTLKNQCPSLYEYLINRYDDCDNIKETYGRILNHLDKRPTCPFCGKPLKYFGGREYSSTNGNHLLYSRTCGSPECQELSKNLSHQRWFDEHYPGCNYINVGQIPEVKAKISETMQKNHTFRSNKEKEVYEDYLIHWFKEDEIKHDHLDKRYETYMCDFYIKPLDLFIELHFYFTHQFHPYDVDDPRDIEYAEFLYKQGTSINRKNKYLGSYIEWTQTDPRKYELSQINGFNYLAFYDIKDWYNFVNRGELPVIRNLSDDCINKLEEKLNVKLKFTGLHKKWYKSKNIIAFDLRPLFTLLHRRLSQR